MGTEQLPVDNDTRLAKIETKVDQIHLALCGDLAGTAHGLHARVAKLEAWAKWLATIVTALVVAAFSQLMGFKGLR
jgi:hypothetical protein